MALSYPVAKSARQALSINVLASTLAEARTYAPDAAEIEFVSEWVKAQNLPKSEQAKLLESACLAAHLEVYETEDSKTVFAVSYWRVRKTPKKTSKTGKARMPRRKRSDPDQLDLFPHGPDQRGYEHPDPDNPHIILVDEEGDGAAFGKGPIASPPKPEP